MNFYYTIISQVNYVIAHETDLVEMGSKGKDVVAQAYTIRAFAYTCLYEWFCQGNYAVNSDAPGVPIYTKPTSADTKGNPRGKVSDVFVQINSDFEKAIEIFEEAAPQSHISHVDKYAAYLLWARAALIQEDWENAVNYAVKALEKPGLSRVASLGDLGAFNDRESSSVMWAFEVITDQTSPFGPFLSHMDPEGGYGESAYQCIDAWLWEQIPVTDARKTTWWSDGANFDQYTQLKFRYSDKQTNLGDGIFLRAEEAILIAAEAHIRKATPDYATARTLLLELGSLRDSNYAVRLATFPDTNTYNTDTHGTFTTLLDEILFQRRVELWCEGLGRAFDLRRLNLGYTRDYPGSNHSVKRTLQPGDPRLVSLIPQKEFDSNESFTVADQNPR